MVDVFKPNASNYPAPKASSLSLEATALRNTLGPV